MRKNPTLRDRARELRENMTPAEKILWSLLRDRRLVGFKFRRQQVVGSYIVDFFCATARLIVELDGETHLGKEPDDQRRQSWLEKEGYRVLRFWNTDVYEDKEVVIENIWRECESRTVRPLIPDPSPPRGEGRI
jgi:very-short-patch-repair endonuclease